MECLAVTRKERPKLNRIPGSSINRPIIRMAGRTKFLYLKPFSTIIMITGEEEEGMTSGDIARPIPTCNIVRYIYIYIYIYIY